jgi:hypothetical protein
MQQLAWRRCWGLIPLGPVLPTDPGTDPIEVGDVQQPRLADLDRFVSFGRHRRGFQKNQQAFTVASRLSG